MPAADPYILMLENDRDDRYITETTMDELGFTLPDPELKKNNETGRWQYTEPDWEEFKRVINGDGPCNKERLEVRRIAEERGRWVREALKSEKTAYVTPLA